MTYNLLKENLLNETGTGNKVVRLDLNNDCQINVYPNSVNKIDNEIICVADCDNEKHIYIFSGENKSTTPNGLKELNVLRETKVNDMLVKECSLSTHNRKILQNVLDNLKPSVIGLHNSFGFGDRIGLANPAHLRALEGSDFYPVLAQQSIRELTRTNRTPDEVMDAAVWAVMQEGFKGVWGADADHLKTKDDIDLMAKAGYTMFTFDPSDYVDNSADDYDEQDLNNKVENLDWELLNDKFDQSKTRYLDKEILLNDDVKIEVDEINLKRAYAKYGGAIIHIKKLFEYLKANYSGQSYEVEVSVDETESVTSPFEHYFFASELTRLGVQFVSLAPRFIGDFEKGIDYKGDLNVFKQEYEKHVAIINHFGTYKISLHSGSDKFSAYKVIGGIKNALTHVKTAGTSYLEALKVTAIKQPDLFRSILDYSAGLYENEKKTYHVSADVSRVKNVSEYNDDELVELFNNNDVRQILHVAFGKVLTDKDENGNYLFKNKILDCLIKYEETHYDLLIKHFRRHLEPFEMN